MGRKTIGRFVNNTAQSVAANSNILFTLNSISTNAIGYDGAGGIQLKAPGVYMVYTNFTGSPASASTPVEVKMFQNNTEVPGASASETKGATTDVTTIGFNEVVTVYPSSTLNGYATLFLKTVAAVNFSNVNVIIEKVA